MAPSGLPLGSFESEHVSQRSYPYHSPLDASDSMAAKKMGIVEAWAQGFNVGGIIILIMIILCNYRKGILLHKLILLELSLAILHGTFIFMSDPVYGRYLSATAALVYLSYNLHNLVSWMKIKHFLPRWGSRVFLISFLCVQPYWILETFANAEYFNNLGVNIFPTTRYFEPLFRDPWWVFTTVKLCLVIKQGYDISFIQLIRASPRFGIMLLCMLLSIIFLVTDVIITAKVSEESGLNPYWRLALVFKCASDTIFLDDFKTVLDHIVKSALKRMTLSGISDGTHPSRKERGYSNAMGPNAYVNAKKRSSAVHDEGMWKQKNFRGVDVDYDDRFWDSADTDHNQRNGRSMAIRADTTIEVINENGGSSDEQEAWIEHAPKRSPSTNGSSFEEHLWREDETARRTYEMQNSQSPLGTNVPRIPVQARTARHI